MQQSFIHVDFANILRDVITYGCGSLCGYTHMGAGHN